MDQGYQLRRGLTHPRSVVVTEAMTAGRLRADPIRVFATPEMIRLVEQTAAEALAPFLAAGQQSASSSRPTGAVPALSRSSRHGGRAWGAEA